MEKLQKHLPSPLIILAFLLSFAALYAIGMPTFEEPDMSWHIAAGDLIRETGKLPEHDPWSFNGSEQIWYNISWLWDIALSFVHEKTGMKGIFVFTKILPALLVAFLLASLKSRGNIGNNALIFTGMTTTYCMLQFTTGRPQIVGLLFALIFQHILHSSRDNNKNHLPYILPVIMALWANIHGSFFVGISIVGAYGIESIINKDKTRFIKLFIIGILCLVAILANPYGIHIITAVMRTLDSAITPYIREWRPFVFGDVIGATVLFLIFIFFGNLKNEKVAIADKILALVWFLAMLLSIRNMGIAAVLSAPYIAANLPADDNVKDANTRKLNAWINNKRASAMLSILTVIAIIISYGLLDILGSERYIEKKEKSPLAAVNYIIDNYPGKRVFNDYDYGGRIAFETKGKVPFMFDGRAGTAYSEKIITDYIAVWNTDNNWQELTDLYKIDIFILGNERPFSKNYEKGSYRDAWQQVYRDDVASVYVRKEFAITDPSE